MLLEIENLTTVFPSATGRVRAVNNVSFGIDRGEILAVVGESGSGKSVTALSVTRLVPQPPAVIESGRAMLDGQNLLALPRDKLRRILGRRVAMLFQNAYAALHPIQTIGKQLVQAVAMHKLLSRADATRHAAQLLTSVGFSKPHELMERFPFQVSAGDAQRAMLAIALAGDPDLLIADEPTSLLDAIAQDEILTLLKQLQRDRGMAVWLITHDFGVVSRMADRVVVMYAGQAVESGPADALLSDPRHPYSQGLLASIPDARAKGTLRQIPGEIPDLARLPAGCAFRARCDRAMQVCAEIDPSTQIISSGRVARCWLYAES